jgi:hypothetical protein
MIQLPHEMRDTIVEQLDDYLEVHTGAPDGEMVAAYLMDLIVVVAEELKVESADEIVLKLESSGELEASLQELLEEEFESNDEFEFTGEEIVALIERVCEVEWTAKDDDDDDDDDGEDDEDDPDGFFDDAGGDDDEDM